MGIKLIGMFGALIILLLTMAPAQARTVIELGPPVEDKPGTIGKKDEIYVHPPGQEKPQFRKTTYKRGLRPLHSRYNSRKQDYNEISLSPPVQEKSNNFSGDPGNKDNKTPEFLAPPLEAKPAKPSNSPKIKPETYSGRPAYDNLQNPGTVYGQ